MFRRELPWAWTAEQGRSVAALACTIEGCGNVICKGTAKGPPPQQLAKWFRQQGWDLDLRAPAKVRCPGCQQRKTKMSTATNGAAASTITITAGQPRALTPDERGKVRDLLELNFDAKAGRFISGYSDERIAKEVNVPRKAVETLREAAYGELKISPEMAKAMDDIADLAKDGNKIADEVLAMHQKVQAFNVRAASLLARIEGRVN